MRGLRLAFGLLAAASLLRAGSPPPGMVMIPAGEYRPLIFATASPASVTVQAFYLDQFPVTNGQFLDFVRAVPRWRRSRVSSLFAEEGYLGDWSADLELGPQAPARSPVVRVSWFAANAYARWKGLRLPSMAEWERAASAGFRRAEGDRDPQYREATLKWFTAGVVQPLPSAESAPRNFFGAAGMTTLIWEWVDDFNSTLVAEDSRDEAVLDRNLFCGSAAAGVRSFADYPAFMRLAFRSSLRANYAIPNLGFRCAKSL